MSIHYKTSQDIIQLYKQFNNSEYQETLLNYSMKSLQIYKYQLFDPSALRYVETSMDAINSLYKHDNTDEVSVESDCGNICLLQWIDNSCYADVVLASLLVFCKDFMLDEIINKDVKTTHSLPCQEDGNYEAKLNIQHILKQIYDSFQTRKPTCTQNISFNTLREYLLRCPTSNKDYESLASTKANDSRYFVNYILELFEVNKANYKILSNVNNETVIETTTNNPITWEITSRQLAEYENHDYRNIGLFLIDKSNEVITILENSPYIIFTLNRNHGGGWLNTNILPTESLVLLNGRILQLTSIIVWLEEHYTSYIKCNNNWYYYD